MHRKGVSPGIRLEKDGMIVRSSLKLQKKHFIITHLLDSGVPVRVDRASPAAPQQRQRGGAVCLRRGPEGCCLPGR